MRFRSKRFHVAENDVSTYYSRLESPECMKMFLCLDEVRMGDVIDLGEGETYTCPYTRDDFEGDELA